MVRFSIIIPTYGRLKYIPELVESIRPQLSEDTEVIFVEGKAPQDYEALLKEESVRKINAKTYYLPRCTLAASRNFGASKASGEWLIFCDDDDVFVDSKLKEVREAIRPDYLVYYSDCFVFDERGLCQDSGLRLKVNPGKTTGKVLLFLSNFISGGSAFVIHSSIARVFPFDESLKGSEDHDFWRRLVLNNIPIYFINKKLTGYRFHGRNMTQSHLRSWWHEVSLFKKYVFLTFFLLIANILHFFKLCLKLIIAIARLLKGQFLKFREQ
jgi:glycosyltransferase involved in cell wall biosynthesis